MTIKVILANVFLDFFVYRQLIDQLPIEEYNVRSLRSQIGIVQQEPVLFDRSIRDNILYGIDEPEKISQEEIEEACRNSNIHHVICSLPNVRFP